MLSIKRVGKESIFKRAGKQVISRLKQIKNIIIGGVDVAIGEIGQIFGLFSPLFRPPEPGWPSLEFHAPGYNFLGPGTNYKQRIARGDKPVDFLDACAKRHDGVYSRTDLTIKEVTDADKTFLNCIRSKKGRISQQLMKFVLEQIFKGKRELIRRGLLDPRRFTRTKI